MEKPSVIVEEIIERVEAYGNTSIELSKLKLLRTATNVSTSIAARFGIMCTVFICVLMLTIGVALMLGDMLGKSYYGFFIVAAIYLTAAKIFKSSLQKWLKKPVSEFIISQSLQ